MSATEKQPAQLEQSGAGETLGLMPPSNWLIDALETVLPDMSMVVLFMLIALVYMATTGNYFGLDQDVSDATNAAAEVAARYGAPPF